MKTSRAPSPLLAQFWVHEVPGKETMTPTITGIKAARIIEDNDSRQCICAIHEQPDYTIMAFNYGMGV